MVRVKICGITTAKDAFWAARCGADAVGFNFVDGTPRYIEPEKAKPIVLQMPPFVSAVGVFANASPEKVQEIFDFCNLDYAQLHGHETPAFCQRLSDIPIIKAIHIETEEDLKELERYKVNSYLLDARVKGKLGGTGQTIDWNIARRASQYGNILLAGGLNPDNVIEAVKRARPYAVDVASGVEYQPGQKSRTAVRDFIRLAKSVEL